MFTIWVCVCAHVCVCNDACFLCYFKIHPEAHEMVHHTLLHKHSVLFDFFLLDQTSKPVNIKLCVYAS